LLFSRYSLLNLSPELFHNFTDTFIKGQSQRIFRLVAILLFTRLTENEYGVLITFLRCSDAVRQKDLKLLRFNS